MAIEVQPEANDLVRQAASLWGPRMAISVLATLASVDASNRALRLLDPTHRRIEDADDIRVIGNLRVPRTASELVLVVLLIPGLDSTKEKLPSWEEVLLRSGMSTFAVDGPGPGDVFHLGTRILPAYEQTPALTLDTLKDDPRVDMNRVVVAATSLGGLYAMRACAYVRQVRAVVSLSGPVKRDIDTLKPNSAAALAFCARVTEAGNARRHVADLDLTGVAEALTKPALFATGEPDRIIPWEQTEANYPRIKARNVLALRRRKPRPDEQSRRSPRCWGRLAQVPGDLSANAHLPRLPQGGARTRNCDITVSNIDIERRPHRPPGVPRRQKEQD